MLLPHISVHEWFSFLETPVSAPGIQPYKNHYFIKTGKAAANSCGRFSRIYFIYKFRPNYFVFILEDTP